MPNQYAAWQLRDYRDGRGRNLIGEGMNWYMTLGHDLYTAFHLTGELRDIRLTEAQVERLLANRPEA